MRCKNCSKKILDGLNYCSECAKDLRICMLCIEDLPEDAHGSASVCPTKTGRKCKTRIKRIKDLDFKRKSRKKTASKETTYRQEIRKRKKQITVLTSILTYYMTPTQFKFIEKTATESLDTNNPKLLSDVLCKTKLKGWSKNGAKKSKNTEGKC